MEGTYRTLCTVLEVKPYSGYYRSCPTCKRKLSTIEVVSSPEESSRYWCRGCRVDCGTEELRMCYCLILTVTDAGPTTAATGATMDVALFGTTLDQIFGLPAAQMHKHLSHLDNGGGTGQWLIVGALRMLLIGACVELRFARGALHHGGCATRTLAEIKKKMKMSKLVATGVRLLGASSNETVLSLLSTRSPQPSMMSQQNSVRSQQKSNDHDSSSFLYDNAKSQVSDSVTQKTSSLLQLDSFTATQSEGGLNVLPLAQGDPQSESDCSSSHSTSTDDVEITEGIVRELETEWESTQLSQRHQGQLLETELALSEDLLSELQQSFDQPSPAAPTPLLPKTAATPLSQITDGDLYVCRSSTASRMCYGTPELFSSHKKPSHKRDRVGVPGPCFTPELFGPTPLVSRYKNDDDAISTSLSITPSAARSKEQAPKRTLLCDTPQALSHNTTSQVLGSGSRHNTSSLTPLTHSKESLKYDDVSSPDLFS